MLSDLQNGITLEQEIEQAMVLCERDLNTCELKYAAVAVLSSTRFSQLKSPRFQEGEDRTNCAVASDRLCSEPRNLGAGRRQNVPDAGHTVAVVTMKANISQRGLVCKVVEQCCGTLVTNEVVTEFKVLQRAEACRLGSQCCGTHVTNTIATKVNVLQRGDACKVGC